MWKYITFNVCLSFFPFWRGLNVILSWSPSRCHGLFWSHLDHSADVLIFIVFSLKFDPCLVSLISCINIKYTPKGTNQVWKICWVYMFDMIQRYSYMILYKFSQTWISTKLIRKCEGLSNPSTSLFGESSAGSLCTYGKVSLLNAFSDTHIRKIPRWKKNLYIMLWIFILKQYHKYQHRVAAYFITGNMK